MTPREFFPYMPDEVFEMWLAPFIQQIGWSFTKTTDDLSRGQGGTPYLETFLLTSGTNSYGAVSMSNLPKSNLPFSTNWHSKTSLAIACMDALQQPQISQTLRSGSGHVQNLFAFTRPFPSP